MALVIGLVAAAAKAISSNDNDRHQNNNHSRFRDGLYHHHNSHNSHNSGHHSCCNSHHNSCCNTTSSPLAAYSPLLTGSRRAERRMERKLRKAERKGRNTDMLLSMMGGSRGASGSTGLSGDSATASTHHHHQPGHGGGVPYVGYGESSRGRDVSPESQRGHQWRDDDEFQGHERTGSSSEALPSYEQAVRRSDKSRR
ncbi:uncharacterized protein TRIREDRAFT_107715 [Trichoderma reesei QM6a]|uniref:Predicted protein n=2 Tax=Hypocrea jecorina TaxID=51453 RepID=G0RJZ6_HYPJQ|nr:uncharacterized protein TRIREDRAFT_107715 [Trichoderma reesei QM6a]EGR48380.1 predicted protein [Trichoderma reesei QM6a]ETS06961.1 hypothetical protein M419DRAFT_32223 [Trichoderma reesei RUT C-30]